MKTQMHSPKSIVALLFLCAIYTSLTAQISSDYLASIKWLEEGVLVQVSPGSTTKISSSVTRISDFKASEKSNFSTNSDDEKASQGAELKIVFSEPSEGVVMSLEKFSSVRRGTVAKKGQIIRVHGNYQGTIVEPQFIFNAGSLPQIDLIDDGLEIRSGLTDDVLVYFPGLIESITITNGEVGDDASVSTNLELGRIGCTGRNEISFKTLEGIDFCDLDQCRIYLDGSASMQKADRWKTYLILMDFIQALNSLSPNMELIIQEVFTPHPTEERRYELDNSVEVERFLYTWVERDTKQKGGFGSWMDMGRDLESRNNSNSLEIIFTDGPPNGSGGQKVKLVDAFDQMLHIIENVVVINVNESIRGQNTLAWYYGDDFMRDVNEFMSVNCDQSSFSTTTKSKVYPNPTSDRVIVEILAGQHDFNTRRFELTLTTSNGLQYELTPAELYAGEDLYQAYNLSGYPRGIYLLTIFEEGKLVDTHRIVLQ